MHGNTRLRRQALLALSSGAPTFRIGSRVSRVSSLGIGHTLAALIVVQVRLAMVAATCALALIAFQVAPASASSGFGPDDSRWQAYYNAPGDASTWSAFCHGGGGSWLAS